MGRIEQQGGPNGVLFTSCAKHSLGDVSASTGPDRQAIVWCGMVFCPMLPPPVLPEALMIAANTTSYCSVRVRLRIWDKEVQR